MIHHYAVMKSVLNRTLLFVGAPLRYLIRYELLRAVSPSNLQTELQRRATVSSATYVEQHMSQCDPTISDLDLLARAFSLAKFDQNQLVLEFGVFSGRTINHLASLARVKVYGFDSFEGLPERWRSGFPQGFFKVDSLPRVKPNVELVKGLFNDTLPAFIQAHPEPVGFLHIDCDLYSSTQVIFAMLRERIGPGCVIVFDEYFNYPGWQDGEFKAFHEFLDATGLSYRYIGYCKVGEQVALLIT